MARSNITPQRLVPISDAAQHVRVNPRTIRRYIADGKLPAYRVGPQLVRVSLDDLDAMIRRIPTAGDAA